MLKRIVKHCFDARAMSSHVDKFNMSNMPKYKFCGAFQSEKQYFDFCEQSDHFAVMERVYFILLEKNIKQSGVSKHDYLANLNERYKNIKMGFSPNDLIVNAVLTDSINVVYRFEKTHNDKHYVYSENEIKTIGEKLLSDKLVTVTNTHPVTNPDIINIVTDLTFVCDPDKVSNFLKNLNKN